MLYLQNMSDENKLSSVSFSSLGIDEITIERLNSIDIKEPTAVQQKVIPELNEGKSLLFQSETGTGKTLAFLLPACKKIELASRAELAQGSGLSSGAELAHGSELASRAELHRDAELAPGSELASRAELAQGSELAHVARIKNPQVIIVSPTHELSSQIKNEISKISDYKAVLCFGGSPIKRQIEALKEKPQFIIGSCTRIKELIFLKKIKISDVKMVIFDEVDRLTKAEMRDDTAELLDLVPKEAQIIGCSATISNGVRKLFEKRASEYIEMPLEDILQNRITHIAIFSPRREKIDTLRSFINAELKGNAKMLIFTSRLDQVENITQKLKYKKINCEALHAKTDKVARKSIIDKFKSGKIPILVTSDLTSRGLDIQNITHVVQMDLPSDTDFFIHRAGRTGRAQKNGINVIIGDEYEMRKLSAMEKKLKIIVYPKVIRYGKLISPKFEDFG